MKSKREPSDWDCKWRQGQKRMRQFLRQEAWKDFLRYWWSPTEGLVYLVIFVLIMFVVISVGWSLIMYLAASVLP